MQNIVIYQQIVHVADPGMTEGTILSQVLWSAFPIKVLPNTTLCDSED